MRTFILIVTALVIVGCDSTDPYRRTDVWVPTGSNAANIAAMAANPRDLLQGRSEGRTDTRAAVINLQQLWQGQSKPLPRASVSEGGQ
jgi:type IV pilus biogenesis protein CpaD/CtpE